MGEGGKRLTAALVATVTVVLACASGALATGGILTGPLAPAALPQVLAGTVPPLVAQAHELGALPANERISFDLPLRLPDAAALSQFVSAEYDPASPEYRHFLTPTQFGQTFGAPAAELTTATTVLRRFGLTVAAPGVNRLFLHVTGTVGLLETLFAVRMERLKDGAGRTFYANVDDISLPAALQGLVTGVVGLDSSNLPQPALSIPPQSRHSSTGTPAAKSGGAPACRQARASGGYTAPNFAVAYDFNGLYAKHLHGEGMSAALVEFDDYHDSNLAAVKACFKVRTPVSRRIVDGGTGGPPGQAEIEDMADLTTLLEMDPKLAHVYVYEAPITDGAGTLSQGAAEIDLYDAFVTDDSAPVLSSSWGGCEDLTTRPDELLFGTVAEEAAAQGQQIFEAAGDSGAVGCRGVATPTAGSVSAQQEAATPWITAVGGTDLGRRTAQGRGGRRDEATWNDLGAGGGGESTVWSIPAWQASYLSATGDTPPGASNDCSAPAGSLCRMEPDVSLDADQFGGGELDKTGPHPHQFAPGDVGSLGYAMYCSTDNCDGARGWIAIGGTSLSTPLTAAAAVLWDQEAKAAGLGTLGFLNPSLYRIASEATLYSADFHDIRSGSNDAAYDPPDCPTGCNPHRLYAARSGFDMATGLGSFDAAKLGGSLVTQAGGIDLTPSAAAVYGYLAGSATTQSVSVTSPLARGAYTVTSDASWLIVAPTGTFPGTLSWHAVPTGLSAGSYTGHITVSGPGGATGTLAVTYTVTARAKISLSARSLHFAEPALDGKGHPTRAVCDLTIWGDELEGVPSIGLAGARVPRSSLNTLRIGNAGPAGSRLHYEVTFFSNTSGWLGQNLNPTGHGHAFQTRPAQPLVATFGSITPGGSADLKLASLANINPATGYPPMNQGTYHGTITVTDLADPSVVDSVPVTLVLGDGRGTPRIAVAPQHLTVRLKAGRSRTLDVRLADASGVCGYAYSLGTNESWVRINPALRSGTVVPPVPHRAPIGGHTGAGNGETPVTISAAGMAPGTYRAAITVESQNAAGNATRVPITLTVTR